MQKSKETGSEETIRWIRFYWRGNGNLNPPLLSTKMTRSSWKKKSRKKKLCQGQENDSSSIDQSCTQRFILQYEGRIHRLYHEILRHTLRVCDDWNWNCWYYFYGSYFPLKAVSFPSPPQLYQAPALRGKKWLYTIHRKLWLRGRRRNAFINSDVRCFPKCRCMRVCLWLCGRVCQCVGLCEHLWSVVRVVFSVLSVLIQPKGKNMDDFLRF